MSGSKSGPVVIMAGTGLLPVTLAQRLEAEGRPYRILAFRGFADKETRRRADRVMDLLDVKGILACLEQWRPDGVVLAGAIRRPRPSVLLSSYSLVRNINELREMIGRGDDNLLRAAVALLEEKGFPVIGAHEIVPDIMSGEGVFSERVPTEQETRAIAHGLKLLDDLSGYDIGQGLVVSGQRILAIEGPEGTDRMLRRVAGLQKRGLLSRSAVSFPNSALVKTAKTGQDLRVDMPAIGPKTVREVARAGLGGIACGRTLILHKDETIREANRLKVFLIGVRPG